MGECYYMPDLVNNDFQSLYRKSWDTTFKGIDLLNGSMFNSSIYDQSGLNSIYNTTNMGLNALSWPNTSNMYSTMNMYPMMSICQNMCPTQTCATETSQPDVQTYVNDPTVQALAEEIHDQLSPWPILNENDKVQEIFNRLKDNPQKLAALELAYGDKYGSPDKLRQDIRRSCGGITGLLGIGKPNCDQINALNEAAKTSPINATIALKEATSGIHALGKGCDETTVNTIMNYFKDDKTQLAQIALNYKDITGYSLQNDLKKIGHWGTGLNNEYADIINDAYIEAA